MRTMPAGLVGGGDEDVFTVLYAEDGFVDGLQFRRVDGVVGGVDGGEGGGDAFEIRLGVVVAGGVDVVEEVVGVGGLEPGGNLVFEVGVGLFAGGKVRLGALGVGAHDHE